MKFESEKISEPFLTVLNKGGSVDYKCDGADHEYVKKLGYKPEMHSDCSMSAKGLNGISLSSYGDWGTVWPEWMDETSKKIFIDMVESDIITLWRCRIYINHIIYDYNDGGWECYDESEKWKECDAPDIFN